MNKIIIIGGGISGLSAGIYAQRAGFKSTIYEKHTISGGECTGWDRHGFHIDGCVHWLTGTKEGTKLNHIWKETGALENVEIYQPECLVVGECNGIKVKLHRNLDKLKTHLIEVSPEDTEEIVKLCEYIKILGLYEIPSDKPVDLMNILELMKFLSSMRETGCVIKSLGKLTVSEYLQRFKNPAIIETFKSIIPEHYSAYTLPFSLGTAISGNGGRPKGGSRALAKRMEEKYKSLGGEILFRKEVRELIIQDNVATGIILTDGTKEYADYIVPTCDTHVTFQKLLKGKFSDKKLEARYKNPLTYPLQSSVLVSFGVDADLSSYPEGHLFETQGYRFENHQLTMLSIKHYCHEPSFAPSGKSVIIVYFLADYEWWKELHNDQGLAAYKVEKERLAQQILERIEQQYPELKGKIRNIDVTTPLTHERYCGAYKGSWMSFGVTPKGKQLMHNGKIKGLKNLYMAGQWLIPSGGLPIAVITGKWAIQRICKQEKVT